MERIQADVLSREMNYEQYVAILTRIRDTLETFENVEKFSTDNKGAVYVWGNFSNQETEQAIIQSISDIDPAIKVILNPRNLE